MLQQPDQLPDDTTLERTENAPYLVLERSKVAATSSILLALASVALDPSPCVNLT